jgi:hypothetical protein
MRTPHHAVTSAGRFSAWLVALLGLGAYVGLIYGLTVFPLQLELPAPYWATFAVPAAVYGLLILLFVRRPTILRWIVGTALLSGVHVGLVMAREPLSVMLDPALAGRPLPWMLPPPFPELVGVFLLLVPLRDLLRARPRLARERTGSIRASSSVRGRGSVVPRVPHRRTCRYGSGASPLSQPKLLPRCPLRSRSHRSSRPGSFREPMSQAGAPRRGLNGNPRRSGSPSVGLTSSFGSRSIG